MRFSNGSVGGVSKNPSDVFTPIWRIVSVPKSNVSETPDQRVPVETDLGRPPRF